MSDKPSPLTSIRPFLIIGGVVLAAVTLSWAEKILIPLVLAVLLTFILSPLVNLLQRHGVPRVPAALLVVVLAFVVVCGVGAGLTLQVKRLAGELPQYQQNIARKAAGVRGLGEGGWLHNLRSTFREITGEASGEGPTDTAPAPPSVPVRMESSGLSQIGSFLGPAAETLSSAGLVVVLVIFMLIQREGWRNRLVRLVPQGRLLATTRALTEAADRLSRFLLMQLTINAGYGLVVGVGLYLIGMPYALVWGILTAFLRYLPFVGTLLAMALITLFSVGVFPGWAQPLLTAGLLVAVELTVANVVEPLLFGHSTGVSPMALLVAAAFWTWLWGPVGLILSTPLTVCLLVLGRYVPNMEFLGVLLSDEPALDTEITFYQRLLARDQDEATALLEQFVQANRPDTVYDQVLVPALSLAKADRRSDELTADAERFIYGAIREILDEPLPSEAPAAGAERGTPAASPSPQVLVLGCPARDETDELALQMLARLLQSTNCRVELVASGSLAGEMLARVRREAPSAVCVGTVLPGGLVQAQYLCKRLRAEFPSLKIVAGLWGARDNREGWAKRLRTSGADQVAPSLAEARDTLVSLVQPVGHIQIGTPA